MKFVDDDDDEYLLLCELVIATK